MTDFELIPDNEFNKGIYFVLDLLQGWVNAQSGTYILKEKINKELLRIGPDSINLYKDKLNLHYKNKYLNFE